MKSEPNVFDRASRLTVLLGMLLLPALFLTAFQPDPVAQQITVLYDGDLGGTPDTQGFSYVALASGASQTFNAGVTTLDTTAVKSDQAGYFATDQPVLDRETGYALQLTAQVIAETHDSPHRAGFSIIILSTDLQGIELGFWSNEIWAQEGGTNALFTHAEGINFDTTADLVEYELLITGDTYTLSADGSAILNGPLRDYTAFEGLLDPYETPNLLFLGDNTSRAQSKTNIAYVALQTTVQPTSAPSPPATHQSTPTRQPTATSTSTASPTAAPTSTATPTHQPTRAWNWWLPFTSGYSPQ